MSKTFRPWNVDQHWLLPPSIEDFVPAGHLAHFVRDTVRETLDLSSILSAYEEERGYPPYHPAMMTALLLYGYSQGIYSSRRLAKACEERVDFMAVTGMSRPDAARRRDARLGGQQAEALDQDPRGQGGARSASQSRGGGEGESQGRSGRDGASQG